jgi:hypothetical protein
VLHQDASRSVKRQKARPQRLSRRARRCDLTDRLLLGARLPVRLSPGAQTRFGNSKYGWPPCGLTTNLNTLALNLTHQRRPGFRLPSPHQPHPRPLVGLPVDRQARQFQRSWRRPALDGRDPGRLEGCGPSRRLKFSLPGQYAAAPMRLTHFETFEGQSSARAAIAPDSAAEPTTRSAGFELGLFSRLKKRSRSRLASGIRVHPLAQSGLLARTPCLAREEIPIRHEALFHGKRVAARRPASYPRSVASARALHGGSFKTHSPLNGE